MLLQRTCQIYNLMCVCQSLRIGEGGAVVQMEWSWKSEQLHRGMPGIPEVSPGENLSCGLILPLKKQTLTHTHTNISRRGWRRGGGVVCGKASGGFSWLICKNVDSAGEGLPSTVIAWQGVEVGWEKCVFEDHQKWKPSKISDILVSFKHLSETL